MPKTIIAEQVQMQQLETLRGTKYAAWTSEIIAAGSLYAANEYDIGAALRAKWGTTWDVPGLHGYMATNKSLYLRFNAITEDIIFWDISVIGKVWMFVRGDLVMDKIFLQNEGAEDATFHLVIFGPKYLGDPYPG